MSFPFFGSGKPLYKPMHVVNQLDIRESLDDPEGYKNMLLYHDYDMFLR